MLARLQHLPHHTYRKKYHIVITGKTNSGKEVQEDFTVTSGDYDKYNTGDQFNYDDVSHDEQD